MNARWKWMEQQSGKKKKKKVDDGDENSGRTSAHTHTQARMHAPHMYCAESRSQVYNADYKTTPFGMWAADMEMQTEQHRHTHAHMPTHT